MPEWIFIFANFSQHNGGSVAYFYVFMGLDETAIIPAPHTPEVHPHWLSLECRARRAAHKKGCGSTKVQIGKKTMLEKAQQRDAENRAFEKEIKKFGELVMSDANLLAQLDQTPDKGAFIDRYVALARTRGIEFTKTDLEIAVQEQKQGHDWIIPKQVLRMIADRF